MNPACRPVLSGALLTLAADRTLRHVGVPGGSRRWARVNHLGHEVTLLEGVALVCGSAAALTSLDPVAAVTALGTGLTGALDDLHPDAARKGLAGHLGALAHGEVSGGALKILGLSACGVWAATADGRGTRRAPATTTSGVLRSFGDLVVRAGLVAGSANLVNLLDLRPGRALKVALLIGIPLSTGRAGPAAARPAAAAVGSALVLLPGDLRAVGMLGDTGANAVGALLGLSTARWARPAGRVSVLAAIAGLTLVSERVSFTRVIEAMPILRELDAWGRLGR